MELTLRPDRPTMSRLFEAVLVLFLAGLVLQNLHPWLPPFNRVLGGVLAILAVASWIRRRGGIRAEVALFGAFVAWGFVTGLLFARDKPLVLSYVRLLAQELILMFALAEYVCARKTPTFAFLLLLVLPLGLLWYARATGEISTAQGGVGDWRLLSLTNNPNGAGGLCLYGFFGLAYLLWNRMKSGLRFWPLLALVPIGFTLLLTGSRQSIVSVGVFALLWTFSFYGSGKVSKLRSFFLLLVVGAALVFAGRFMLESTPVGGRFRATASDPHLSTDRFGLYREGWKLFRRAPIQGVGLGNFVVYSYSGRYAHSDAMEALATTGLVGFVLYFSIYVVLWRRLRRVLQTHSDATSRYMAGLYQAVIVTLLVHGLSAPSFLDVLHLYIIGAMAGHARVMEQDLPDTCPAEGGAVRDETCALPASA